MKLVGCLRRGPPYGIDHLQDRGVDFLLYFREIDNDLDQAQQQAEQKCHENDPSRLLE